MTYRAATIGAATAPGILAWAGRTGIALGLLTFGLTSSAAAQEWTLGTHASEKVLYNDNLLLNPDHQIETFGSVTTPGLKLTRTSPTTTLSLSGDFPYTAYFNHSDLNTADQLVNFTGKHSLSERSTLSLIGDFDRDTTLTSEDDVSDRFLAQQIRRTTWDVGPSWNYLLSPIDQLTLSAYYRDINYDSTSKIDYDFYSTEAEYAHQLSETAAITASVNFTRFEPDDQAHTRTNQYGSLFGYRYTPSERLLISGAAGLSYNTTTSNQGDENKLGYRAKVNFQYQTSDQLQTSLQLSHDSEPSGDGRQVTRNRASLIFNYRINELTTLGFNTTYTDNVDYLGTQTSTTNGSGQNWYIAAGPSLSYRLTEHLSLVAQYQFRHKVFQSDGGSATGNAAFLTLRYDFQDLSWGGL